VTTTVEPDTGSDPWPGIPSTPPATVPEGARKTPEEASEDHFQAAVDKLMAELLTAADLDNITDLEPLIADVLFKGTIARINGASGTFKSFLTLDFAACIGTGTPWHGRRVHQGLVIYLVAEGIKGMRKRVRAWEQHNGIKMTGVMFLPRPVQAIGDEWIVLMEVCRRLQPVLIICDTQARITVGVEENSATEMGRVVDRVEKLREVCESCILLIHHTGLEGERGRGSTAVKGALQTEISVVRTGKGLSSTLKVSSGKQKDDEELQDIVLTPKSVKLIGEAKEDGSPVTSIVLVPAEESAYRAAVATDPNSVEEIVAKLDQAKVPVDLGRDQLKARIGKLGIKASNDKLGKVIKLRKSSQTDLSPDLSYSPVAEMFPNCPDAGTGTEETADQTCPGQVGDNSGTADPDLSCPPPLLKEGDRQDSRPLCTDCGKPLNADWAARGYDACVICDTTEENS
jgi:hypothetical protein